VVLKSSRGKVLSVMRGKKIYVKGRRSTAILEMDNSQRLVSSVRDEIRSKTSTLKFFFVVNS
jgi:hypothetical protein